MNQCNFIGRLTATPEIKTTQNGKSVCNFTLAVERRFKGADGKPIVDFLDFVAWEHNAEFLGRYFDKGVRVGVSAEVYTRTYQDAENKNRKTVEFLANIIEFADGKAQTSDRPAENNTNKAEDTSAADAFEVVPHNEDLPF